jgi:alpha-L-fucosidase
MPVVDLVDSQLALFLPDRRGQPAGERVPDDQGGTVATHPEHAPTPAILLLESEARQLTELVTRYHPAVLWFDGEWIPEWTEEQGQELYRYLMELDPNLIINNRIGKGRKGMSGMNEYEDAAGDFGTPEQ